MLEIVTKPSGYKQYVYNLMDNKTNKLLFDEWQEKITFEDSYDTNDVVEGFFKIKKGRQFRWVNEKGEPIYSEDFIDKIYYTDEKKKRVMVKINGELKLVNFTVNGTDLYSFTNSKKYKSATSFYTTGRNNNIGVISTSKGLTFIEVDSNELPTDKNLINDMWFKSVQTADQDYYNMLDGKWLGTNNNHTYIIDINDMSLIQLPFVVYPAKYSDIVTHKKYGICFQHYDNDKEEINYYSLKLQKDILPPNHGMYNINWPCRQRYSGYSEYSCDFIYGDVAGTLEDLTKTHAHDSEYDYKKQRYFNVITESFVEPENPKENYTLSIMSLNKGESYGRGCPKMKKDVTYWYAKKAVYEFSCYYHFAYNIYDPETKTMILPDWTAEFPYPSNADGTIFPVYTHAKSCYSGKNVKKYSYDIVNKEMIGKRTNSRCFLQRPRHLLGTPKPWTIIYSESNENTFKKKVTAFFNDIYKNNNILKNTFDVEWYNETFGDTNEAQWGNDEYDWMVVDGTEKEVRKKYNCTNE